MSDRYQGGIIRATPLEPSSSSASGIWTMEQQAKAEAAGNWPSPPPPAVQVDRSLRFNSADSAKLTRTPGSAGNRKTWTWSGWVKRSAFPVSGSSFFEAESGSNYCAIFFDGNNYLNFQERVSASNNALLTTSQVFRDPSAWYHIVLAVDTTQATSSDRAKFYVNGSQVTAFGTATYPSQNLETLINNSILHNISSLTSSLFFDGYMANIDFVDGQALDASYFGAFNATTGVWEPVTTVGYLTYGTNGFHLDFADNTSTTTIGYDTSGNGNNWTANNFSVTAGTGNDSFVDTPTPYGTDTGAGGEVGGNYATWSSVASLNGMTLSNGNLLVNSASTSYKETPVTFAIPTTGVWKFELTFNDTIDGSSNDGYVGFLNTTTGANAYNSTYFSFWPPSAGDIVSVQLDRDSATLKMYKNGSLVQTVTSIAAIELVPYISLYNTSVYANFGQRPYSYTGVSGKALCTTNLPAPDVVQGDTAFNTVLYTATGGTQSITGVGFQPDLVWAKSRSNSTNHGLIDAVRGVSRWIGSNTTSAEDYSAGNYLTAFDSDGFTVAGGGNVFGAFGYTYVAWNWKAGGSGVSNTDGSITSTVSANPTAGISIATYTGTGTNATVGHGLGVAPGMIIVKQRTSGYTYNWVVYHSANTSAPETDYLLLNTTGATVDLNTAWNDTAPTSTVFSIGTDNAVNQNTLNYVAYCFAPVEGFSAFGSYTGNGSTDGPFVYTGFRPAFVLWKISSGGTGSWWLSDNKINTYNVNATSLIPNLTSGDYSFTTIDMLSNGFKCRNNNNDLNTSGYTYIYMAFAENPFKYALAR